MHLTAEHCPREFTGGRGPPLGKLVDPADIAEMVGLPLGPHGGSITGQTITLCGGASL